MRVVVIGAGMMGLAAAWQAALDGHEVTLLEAAPEPGGMAAHFRLGPHSIERYYHFVCKTDTPIFEALAELGIADRMRWVATTMGHFAHGRLHAWGQPLALLRYPHLTLLEKFRYALLAFVSTRRAAWPTIETETAHGWIARWCGEGVYRKMWQRLFALKFHDRAENISAAWIWTRIRRVGLSRRSLMQEELGYIEGGSETLVQALADAIRARGGTIRLAAPVRRVLTDAGCVTGVLCGDETIPADRVICTVPTPLVSALVPDLPPAARAAYDAIDNIGVACVVLLLGRSVTPHFWVNVDEPGIDIPGIIEFSRLRPIDGHVVFVPFYMPVTHPRWQAPDAALIAESLACLARINPAVTPEDIRAAHVGRLRHAQPVCPPGFAARIPPIETAIAGLQIADTCFYYPEDRGTAESIRLGRAMARSLRP